MLSGTRYLTVDAKGRLVIPEHFAKQLGAELVVTHAPGGCLLLFAGPAWRKFLRRQDPERREFFLSGAESVRRHAVTGRIQLPAALRHHSGLLKGADAAVAGVGHALVIARAEAWGAHLRRVETALLQELDRPAPRLWTERLQLPAPS